MESLLSIRHLLTHYPTDRGVVRAVDDVSLEINSGEIVGLVGESGCGKSSLALSIIRLVPRPGQIISGEIWFGGTNLQTLSENEMRRIRGREIAVVFQDPMTYLNPLMKIEDQISEAIRIGQENSKKLVRERIIELLETVQIGDPTSVAEAYPHQLSGGMLQRCLLAIALSSNPRLIIADEPTTSVDVTVQAQLLELMKRLASSLTTSFLVVTHDIGIVAEICDRAYVMYCGKMVEHSDVYSLFEMPLHPYTQALLSTVLSIDEFRKDLVTIRGSVPDLLSPPTGCAFHPRCQECLDICSVKPPPETHINAGHMVRCWLHSAGGRKWKI